MSKARDVVVRFLADTREFLRGSDNVERAFDDMARAEQRVAETGDKSARDIARAYDRAGDKVRAETRTMGRESASSFGEAGKEAGSEFAQNLGEAISSGDVSGTIAGTVGGLAGTFGAMGPIGLAVAGLGAAAVGVFQAIRSGAETAAQNVSDAFEGILAQEDKAATLTRVLEERYGTRAKGIEELGRAADRIGIPLSELTDALVDGGQEADTLGSKLDAVINRRYGDGKGGESAQQLGEMRATARDLKGYLEDVTTQHNEAAAAAQRWADVITDPKVLTAAKALAGYGPGSSTYASQVPRYSGGKRS